MGMGGLKKGGIARDPMFMALAGGCFLVDNYADAYWISQRSNLGWGESFAIAVLVFTGLSEVLVSFFGSMALSAIKAFGDQGARSPSRGTPRGTPTVPQRERA